MIIFQYCSDCFQEFLNAPSWITPLAQSVTAGVALIALIVALRNLRRVKINQALQAQMTLFSLENEVRKNQSNFKVASLKHELAAAIQGPIPPSVLLMEKTNAFELYLSSADKLAALLKKDYLNKHFKPIRNWNEEYKEFFQKVRTFYDSEHPFIAGTTNMISNVNELLVEWE